LNQPIRPALQIWTVVPIISDVEVPFKRVEERVIGYRKLGTRADKSWSWVQKEHRTCPRRARS